MDNHLKVLRISQYELISNIFLSRLYLLFFKFSKPLMASLPITQS